MSFVHRVDNDQRVVVFVAGEDLTEADLQGQWHNPAWTDPEISTYAVLADFRRTRHVSVSLSAMRALAWQVQMQSKRRRERVALVAAGGVAYGMAKVYQSMRRVEGRDDAVILVFRELGEAVEWLGLPASWAPPAIEPQEAAARPNPQTAASATAKPHGTHVAGPTRAEEQLAGVLTPVADMPEWALPLAAEIQHLRDELDTLRATVRGVCEGLVGVPGAETVRGDLLRSLGQRLERGH
jgi:hypothetical protein